MKRACRSGFSRDGESRLKPLPRPSRLKPLLQAFIPLALVAALLAGCGMYGALYLPGEEDPASAAPEVSEQPPIAEEDEDRDEPEDGS